ncbi:MAG: M48 family metalloprotease [Alphaproteobacteria bacterium]|nr:M48 family metalloprotease [Alphaproteobacteria bacterium]
MAFLLLLAFPARAGELESMSFIRDAEIEDYLRSLGMPIFRAAEINPQSVNLLLIQNNAINAFVAGGMNIFFYTGLLQQSESADQLQSVLAHETGHIAGGHLIRGREAMRNASAQAIIGMLAGLAVGVASGNAQAAIGTIGGAQSIAERNLMSFSRAQESSADAAAMRFLDKAGISSQGLLEFMKKLEGQELMPLESQAEYVRTHPFSQDRVQTIEHHVKMTPALHGKTLGPSFQMEHERMKAKLLGFLHPEAALLRYTDKDPRLTARYARAIALYRTAQLPRALTVMETLLKEEPQNPYFLELKAQMLFENGHVSEAVKIYQACVALKPDSALLRVSYAHAILENGVSSQTDLAINQLIEANRLEERNPETWRFLAAAWSRKAETEKDIKYQGLVSYALAEESLAQGQEKEAQRFATRALKTLPKGSPYWLRTQDIKLSASEDSKD